MLWFARHPGCAISSGQWTSRWGGTTYSSSGTTVRTCTVRDRFRRRVQRETWQEAALRVGRLGKGIHAEPEATRRLSTKGNRSQRLDQGVCVEARQHAARANVHLRADVHSSRRHCGRRYCSIQTSHTTRSTTGDPVLELDQLGSAWQWNEVRRLARVAIQLLNEPEGIGLFREDARMKSTLPIPTARDISGRSWLGVRQRCR